MWPSPRPCYAALPTVLRQRQAAEQGRKPPYQARTVWGSHPRRFALHSRRSGYDGWRGRGNLLHRLVLPPSMRTRSCDSTTPALHFSPFVVKRGHRWGLARQLCRNSGAVEHEQFDEVVGPCFTFVAHAPPFGQRREELTRGYAAVVALNPAPNRPLATTGTRDGRPHPIRRDGDLRRLRCARSMLSRNGIRAKPH